MTTTDRPIDWELLRRLAADGRFSLTLVVRPGRDPKPGSKTVAHLPEACPACGVKYPGGPVCGYCRYRVRLLRQAAGLTFEAGR